MAYALFGESRMRLRYGMGGHMERRGEHMERRGEHMERHVGIARGQPHVARGWREWRQSGRDGGA